MRSCRSRASRNGDRAGRRQVHPSTQGPAQPPQCDHRAHRRGARLAVKNGYDETMGARPLARVIQAQIETPLADEVLFGRLKNGGVVKVVVTGDDTARRSSASLSRGSRPAAAGARPHRRRRGAWQAQEGRAGHSDFDPADDREPAPEGLVIVLSGRGQVSGQSAKSSEREDPARLARAC